MTLHTVNKSPFDRTTLESCLRRIADGGALLLIEDGVYGSLRGTAFTPQLEAALARMTVYALRPDIEARGIQDKILPGVRLVDYAGFVDLVVEHAPVVAWL